MMRLFFVFVWAIRLTSCFVDSNTNAAFLAEHLAADPNCRTAVVGVPKTIDDDLKGGGIGVSFGFDSASGVYAETIGNLCSDARSAGKYWHFVRVMGRNASHLTLECALRCAPNVALIGEEVTARGVTLDAVVDDIATLVEARAREGLTHGVVLVPEGLLAFIPDVAKLMDELSRVQPGASDTSNTMASLSMDAAKTAASLPNDIFAELTRTRDPHGNPRLSAVDTEKLLGRMVKSRIDAAGATRREEARLAAEFSRDVDDGARPERWKDADALIVGVSRSGKTPLASYLAARGMKVANLPLVPRDGELVCPSRVHDVDPSRVFALTVAPEELSSVRANRLRSIGAYGGDEEYSSLRAVRRELSMAKALYAKNPGWTVIDVTHRAIEEIATDVVSTMKASGVLPDAYNRDERETAVDAKFSPVYHFCGYEGRSGLPTDFDATYAYTLGYAAATFATGGANGVIATVTNPEASSPRDWRVAGVPMCRLMQRESREGRERLVIKKTPVDLNGGAFAAFVSRRDGWRMVDRYACPGPVQFSRAAFEGSPREGAAWVERLPVSLRLDAFGGLRSGGDAGEDGGGRGVWAA